MKTIPKYNTYDYFRTIVPSFQSFIPVKRFFLFLSNMAFNKKIKNDERGIVVDSQELTSLFNLKGDEIFCFKWKDTPKISMCMVLPVHDEEYLFVDLNEPEYFGSFDAFQEEVMDKNEIVDYLKYLILSDEAEVVYLGKNNETSKVSQIVYLLEFDMATMKRVVSLIKNRKDIADKIKTRYKIYNRVLDLVQRAKSENIVIFDTENKTTHREHIKKVSDNSYLVLPLHRKQNFFDCIEEKMTKEELAEYLYVQIVEEHSVVVWESKSNTKKVVSNINDNHHEITSLN